MLFLDIQLEADINGIKLEVKFESMILLGISSLLQVIVNSLT